MVEARFVTHARRGRWPDFSQILELAESDLDNLPTSLAATTPLSGIPKTLLEKVESHGYRATRRGLFSYIAEVVTGEREPEIEQQQWVGQLLRRFRFETVETERLRQEIHGYLRGRVLRSEDIDHHLKALLGDFLERSLGMEPIVPVELLSLHGLAEISISDRSLLVARGREKLISQLESLGYERRLDVRFEREHGGHAEPSLVGDRSFGVSSRDRRPLLLYGESGRGKSWALFARALRLAEQGRLVLVVEAAADRRSTCARSPARDRPWKTVVSEIASYDRRTRVGRDNRLLKP